MSKLLRISWQGPTTYGFAPEIRDLERPLLNGEEDLLDMGYCLACQKIDGLTKPTLILRVADMVEYGQHAWMKCDKCRRQYHVQAKY